VQSKVDVQVILINSTITIGPRLYMPENRKKTRRS